MSNRHKLDYCWCFDDHFLKTSFGFVLLQHEKNMIVVKGKPVKFSLSSYTQSNIANSSDRFSVFRKSAMSCILQEIDGLACLTVVETIAKHTITGPAVCKMRTYLRSFAISWSTRESILHSGNRQISESGRSTV